MANPSPGQRLRTKTSDLTDFFRTGNIRSRAADSNGSGSPELLSEPESPVKKGRSRIFSGRSRKKSTQSDAWTSASSTSSRDCDSDVQGSSASGVEKRPSDVPAVPALDQPEEHPLPPIPSPSLGAILAASSSPSKQKLLNRRPSQRFPPHEYTSDIVLRPTGDARGPSPDPTPSDSRSPTPRPQPVITISLPPYSLEGPHGYTSDILVRPTGDARGSSLDSDSRSPTPRPQPILTVSLPPYSLEGYEGMFTLPAATTEVPAEDPQLTPTLSSTNGFRFPTPPLSDSQARLSTGDADSTIKRRGSRHTIEATASSRASRSSRKHVGSSAKPFDVNSTDAEDSEEVISRPPSPLPPTISGPTPTAENRRALATIPYNFAEKATSQPRSIMNSTSARRTRCPPAFPLPPPPASNPPSSALPLIPSRTPLSSKWSSSPSAASLTSHPQAQLLSFLPISPALSTPRTSSSSSPSPASALAIPSRRVTGSISEASAAALPTKKIVEERSGKQNFDMDKATPELLRQALILRNEQFDELARYLLKITDIHVAEKHALHKKITALEQEATRRDNEIKGLTWLVANNRPSSSGSISKSTGALFKHPGAASKPPKAGSPRHSNPAEDSGTESHQTTSGAEESYWASEQSQCS